MPPTVVALTYAMPKLSFMICPVPCMNVKCLQNTFDLDTLFRAQSKEQKNQANYKVYQLDTSCEPRTALSASEDD